MATSDTAVYFDPDRPSHYVARFGTRGTYRWPAHLDGWRLRTALRAATPWDGCVELDDWHAALALALTREQAAGEHGDAPCALCLGPTDPVPVLLGGAAVCDACLVRDYRPPIEHGTLDQPAEGEPTP